ncbi:CRISPR-associated endonuclease Cas2 [Sporomusa ovata]|uniref:CRISPR-associated endonuclease Cas2 n=1 Tax=Sporomusa ovata TaxID=2378 RepID=UPI00048A9AEA|nr:CRISPR-associated endonuclease Cas2 [Sporomusa ovata]
MYDMNTEDAAGRRRLNRIKKICRKYLIHLQKSVFEGAVTEGQYHKLIGELRSIIDDKLDFVVVYTLPDGNKLNRTILTDTPDPADNLL